jgi:pyruvate formate-lyase/glycerol dehydratase family glycyl radical enzyme
MSETIYSPQEKRIVNHSGNQNSETGSNSPRIQRIYKSFRDAKAQVDIQRARYFTESFKQTEGQSLVLRFAKALYHTAENIGVIIEPDQLLAGRVGCLGKYGLIYPELDGCFLRHFTEVLQSRNTSPFEISAEDLDIIQNEIAPYWEGKTYYEDLARSLPEDILKLTFQPEDRFSSRYIVNETSSMRSALQWVHDYERGISQGFEAIKNDALKRKAKASDPSQQDFYEAVAIVSDAIILWAARYSEAAAKAAASETDPKRRKELETLSKICAKVPRYPAETFYEALQSQWFIQLFSRLEQKTGATISNGRMDQYLYPYYQKDKAAGRITPDQAKELLQCMWLGMAQYQDFYAHWEAVTVGGTDRQGQDASNELTYLFLENKREFPFNYPDLAARIHKGAPEAYLEAVAATIKDGSGFPKLINDEEVVPLLVAKGAPIEEARDYAVSGCTEVRLPNLGTYTSPCPFINLGAVVELTLNNGRMRRYGDELLTFESGDPETFKTWDDFFNAFLAQERYILDIAFRQQAIVNRLRPKHFASPLGSALHKLCYTNGKDLHSETIDGGLDAGFFDFIGLGTATDSLSAIKTLIYDTKRVTWPELQAALAADFVGYEPLRQRLKRAPAYGNRSDEADDIGARIDRVAVQFADKAAKEHGFHLDVRYVSQSSNVPFGKVVGALPNGRHAGEALSDGASPSQGADVNGPAAVLLSNAYTKNTDYINRASRLLNLKLSPAVVAGEAGTKRLIALIRTWVNLKLWHLQFNIINQETLLAAQKHPENYRSLLVRVAGYSAYFVELSPSLQRDIINRTEHSKIA